ncbi:hypothetical protein [Pyrobaculum neutrophilum]|uniref:Uncharacterized protein n=1 Tax=Pyrobaculum neutrophilum (strain DSM 2338 / JCM 9278 / NBRC 100436 / V24Sta) TaxID=444157 RepID=B1YBI8_PYRNV|nr:hypothetical protein [Pyrobaculum neutrophilum]ACB40790.1 conserved hypothetical protein [Pyrobaculum neutrophilum V24Sta]
MYGLSEVIASVLLLVISVTFAVLIASVFYNMYFQTQSSLVAEQAREYCEARVVAVTNASGRATIWVYNMGKVRCVFAGAYALDALGNVAAAASTSTSLEPGTLAAINTALPYGYPGYRISTAQGQTFDYWGR